MQSITINGNDMINVNNKIKQASGQNWGKQYGADRKAGETALKNDLDDIQSDKVKTYSKSKKTKTFEIGEEVWVDAHDVIGDDGISLSTIYVKTPEGEKDHFSVLGPKIPGKTAVWFLGKYLVRIESFEINKRSKKTYYRGEVLAFEPKYPRAHSIGNKGATNLVIGRKGTFKK